ncbi:hypothetical protein [Bifidobacterium margollesii]|uniref:hypothetical protein n=1 Tax=Bifidobacterium margollesii TaxID=2020964 RepID=UPI0010551DD7|nr:hypothetical protein [Bifidobacterium margollesii]
MAKAITAITPGFSFEHAARAISILWMIAGLIALYYALRAWDIDRTYCWATCGLVPFIPVFLNPATAVTNDAPGLLVGAGVVWVAKRFFIDEHYGMLVPSVIILLSCCIKGTFAFPFLALLIVVGLRSLVDFIKKKDIQSFRNILSVIGMGIVSLIGVFGWSIIQSHRGDPSYVSAITGVSTRPVRGLPIGEFLKTIMSTFDFSQIPGTLRRTNDSVGYVFWLSILQIVLLGAVFFLYFQNDKKKSQTYLIYSTVLSMLLVPGLIQIREYLSNGSMLIGVSDRYAIAVVPLVLCCWALTLQNSKKPIVGWGVPVIGCFICFSAVLGLMPA